VALMAGLLADFPRRGPGHCGPRGKPGAEGMTGKARRIEAGRLHAAFDDGGDGIPGEAIGGDTSVPVDAAEDRTLFDPGMGEPGGEVTDRAPARASMR